MKIFVIFLLGIHMTCAAIHTLQYFYTATSGIPTFPEFISLGMLDGQQTDYYDSKIKRAIPKVDWMSTEGPEYWNGQTQTCVGTEQSFKNNINVAMSRFNQSGGVHTVQQMYGCELDDQTNKATDAFLQFGYDGEDFVSLDFKEMSWISPVQQGIPTVQKWNNDRGFIESDRIYFSTQCIESLQKYVQYGKSSLQRKVSPQVSLLQKSSSPSVTCHATGFYPSGVTISWMKNGREHDEDVDLGELLPNEDGTFQRTSTITVTPDEWKNNQFSCVVEHQGETKEEKEIRTNGGDSVPIMPIVGVLVAVVLLIAIGGIGYVVYKKKQGFKPVSGSDDGSTSSAQPQA